ncbi:class I SAM-dependent methyltransferase [Pseudoxanthomonas sp. CF125]|uniref:class I SAM-dependent methyltransferase n=1 Tax=Pseudoxanthomonas sp. CF125 TaxID=1855303 RepID=UPI00088FDD63|nr:class I SAM-dependent methyltransferase [Pseudoxanthomonas sp. CF125]SDQ79840.1 Ubiquinone/menaquinone biosynthesis C-methylase UbiE [Pseudoxanthomonas sp. CF125]
MDKPTKAPAQSGVDQKTLWNGSAGRAWVHNQRLLDQLFAPFEALLASDGVLGAATHVLDVGCGTGATTLAIARRLGVQGACVGIDLSEPMIAVARNRAAQEQVNVRFLAADAQAHAFERADFDLIVSRFGVMFFEDPVRAFANLRRAARADARLSFIAWRSAAENPFMTTAERVAAPLLPNLPVRPPGGPGQFAFADPDRIRAVLAESGWSDIDVQAIDVACAMPEDGLVPYLTWLGPVGQLLQDADERTRARIIEPLRAAFAPYVHGGEVRFDAACWHVSARAQGSAR